MYRIALVLKLLLRLGEHVSTPEGHVLLTQLRISLSLYYDLIRSHCAHLKSVYKIHWVTWIVLLNCVLHIPQNYPVASLTQNYCRNLRNIRCFTSTQLDKIRQKFFSNHRGSSNEAVWYCMKGNKCEGRQGTAWTMRHDQTNATL